MGATVVQIIQSATQDGEKHRSSGLASLGRWCRSTDHHDSSGSMASVWFRRCDGSSVERKESRDWRRYQWIIPNR